MLKTVVGIFFAGKFLWLLYIFQVVDKNVFYPFFVSSGYVAFLWFFSQSVEEVVFSVLLLFLSFFGVFVFEDLVYYFEECNC